jgi:hypothetical protein
MRRMLVVLAAVVAVLILGACGDDDDEKAGKQATRPVSGHFIGKTADDRAAVAVLAEGEGTTRRVSVYVSDGVRAAEWFTSKTTANAVTLASEDKDADVRLELSKGVASGTVELSGQSLAFRAPPRTAGEGLYLATITERGYSARSPSDIRLTARHIGATSKSMAEFPDGTSKPFTVQWPGHVRSAGKTLDRPVPGQYRWIATEGRYFGAKKQPAPSDFIDPPHYSGHGAP